MVLFSLSSLFNRLFSWFQFDSTPDFASSLRLHILPFFRFCQSSPNLFCDTRQLPVPLLLVKTVNHPVSWSRLPQCFCLERSPFLSHPSTVSELLYGPSFLINEIHTNRLNRPQKHFRFRHSNPHFSNTLFCSTFPSPLIRAGELSDWWVYIPNPAFSSQKLNSLEHQR